MMTTMKMSTGFKVKAKDLMLIVEFVEYAVQQNLKDQVIDWSLLPPALHDSAENMIDHRMTVLSVTKVS